VAYFILSVFRAGFETWVSPNPKTRVIRPFFQYQWSYACWPNLCMIISCNYILLMTLQSSGQWKHCEMGVFSLVEWS